MAHLLRILTDAMIRRRLVLSGQNLADIDQNTKKSINGDDGGTWSPAASIDIGGAGAIVAGPWVMTGAGVACTTSTGKPILFAKGDAGDYFGIDPANSGASPSIFFSFIRHYSSITNAAGWSTSGILPNAIDARFYTPLPVYSGAGQVDSVVVNFVVGHTHASVPQYLPRMRVIAVSASGDVIPLRRVDATTDPDGFQFFSPAPASGAAWYNGGAAQTWTYTCNVVLPVDSSSYRYFIEFIEEAGTGAWGGSTVGNTYISATVSFSNVTLFDGRN